MNFFQSLALAEKPLSAVRGRFGGKRCRLYIYILRYVTGIPNLYRKGFLICLPFSFFCFSAFPSFIFVGRHPGALLLRQSRGARTTTTTTLRPSRAAYPDVLRATLRGIRRIIIIISCRPRVNNTAFPVTSLTRDKTGPRR